MLYAVSHAAVSVEELKVNSQAGVREADRGRGLQGRVPLQTLNELG